MIIALLSLTLLTGRRQKMPSARRRTILWSPCVSFSVSFCVCAPCVTGTSRWDTHTVGAVLLFSKIVNYNENQMQVLREVACQQLLSCWRWQWLSVRGRASCWSQPTASFKSSLDIGRIGIKKDTRCHTQSYLQVLVVVQSSFISFYWLFSGLLFFKGFLSHAEWRSGLRCCDIKKWNWFSHMIHGRLFSTDRESNEGKYCSTRTCDKQENWD